MIMILISVTTDVSIANHFLSLSATEISSCPILHIGALVVDDMKKKKKKEKMMMIMMMMTTTMMIMIIINKSSAIAGMAVQCCTIRFFAVECGAFCLSSL